ncbi:DUF6470 family protein [Kyrpidia sp.]|uniref:DUF6470 family protein n=1 Tax=Kyrpidia sp. TaxID=2073077 RepID=UPI002582EE5C|nr:DUF6470 family protein [Kyrpidia sp.]MCL6577620.1 DUF6470 family protein [Kyrpidia sp.]
MIPQIQLVQTFASIGLNRIPERLVITSPPAELNMHQEMPRALIEWIPGRLEIDQSEAFAQAGLMPVGEWMRQQVDEARQAVLEAIGEIAQWGDRFSHIEQGGNPIVDWARRYEDRRVETNFALVPQPLSVHFQYTPGRVIIQVQPGRVVVDPVIHRPEITFSPGEVQVYMQRYPSLRIIPPPLPGVLVDRYA